MGTVFSQAGLAGETAAATVGTGRQRRQPAPGRSTGRPRPPVPAAWCRRGGRARGRGGSSRSWTTSQPSRRDAPCPGPCRAASRERRGDGHGERQPGRPMAVHQGELFGQRSSRLPASRFGAGTIEAISAASRQRILARRLADTNPLSAYQRAERTNRLDGGPRAVAELVPGAGVGRRSCGSSPCVRPSSGTARLAAQEAALDEVRDVRRGESDPARHP